ncbi:MULTISPECIES: RdgB/HAM1 family non-canonical purine NTP pyrophosphatase [Moraxella]|jgi:non-canonical purine NTP pyrophosphatase, rdgB/HAM1 family|uniref:dITP/XTP pyrophosphatase n=1 Tax=Moraxella lacunata TaxID=477 RepID=A0A1B8Q4Z3_MORLA|nr:MULTISPECIES: RdgB/HAM1 family non-canonical purine NTP pyrophosphatase [Moraxella]MBE9577830.1 RdgB/HAM1 family non-canonical purine NTP pyrophosphatase [Moraxella sp. K1664]MBE9587252.1 RdgB/HAM1 family non-canonical purine NTP pyrophosphatase [Moraxella sp. K1630]MBE9595596.1 RdgB/HAM1 family non-canonical purine NTP pyrophosphatase [Moraxella sp. K2450]MDH9219281.1 RdgB/HAM1 family non-canonical purine NTP pyrophosphatase [Moraxella lacunata]MDI4481868.1 RdgB/HAM1 family non-canonical p
MKKLILASNNQGKLTEFQSLFDKANLGISIIPQGELGITDADEIGLSFIENAIIKARHASSASGLPALADDSGLCVPVLGNMPGIYSARFSGNHGDDNANNAKLLTELAPFRNGTPIVGKFICVLALVRHADDPLPMIAQGQWVGEILDAPRGENGFGYDPLFYVPSLDSSSAELDKTTKNALSHRGQALDKLIAHLKQGEFDRL